MRKREDEPEDPKIALVKGIGFLWRAARSAATGIKKEVEGTDWAKTIDDAGRELVRATSNVVGRIGSELRKAGGHEDDPDAAHDGKPSDPTRSGSASGKADDSTPGDSDKKPR